MIRCLIIFIGFVVSGCNSHKVPLVPTYQQIPVIQVQKDDTLYSLAKRYDTTVRELAQKNDIADPTSLQIGQDLHLPKAVRVASYERKKWENEGKTKGQKEKIKSNAIKKDAVLVKPEKTSSKSLGKKEALSLEQAKTQIQKTQKDLKKQEHKKVRQHNTQMTKQSKNVPPKKKSSVKTTKLDKPFVAKGKVDFGWPVKGKVISSFGTKGGGIKNDGINIAAPKGTAIKATETGIVVYAGNELKGYGNLLLIRHEKDFMSAYAHADKLYVKTGQVVEKGEKIACVGTSGNVKTPQLHFEIRKKTKSVNPKKYLQ